MKKFLSLATATIFTSANVAFAQDISTEKPPGELGISGYVDTYYQYNLNRPESATNRGRVFDLKHNTFYLGLVQTKFTYNYGKAHVVADLIFGPNADLADFGNEGAAKMIKQAYIAYDLSDKLTFTIGQYGTHIGYELVDAPLNFNYSLSYLFGNGPFYHTGAKLDYALSPHLGLMLGVVNGWDSLTDFNKEKSVTAQVHVVPASGFDVYVNWIGGDENNTLSNFGTADGSYTSLFDLTTTYQVNDAFKVGLNAAYGAFSSGTSEVIPSDPWSSDADWQGAALYLNYDATATFGIGLRGEYFSDPDGIRYFGPIQATAFTLTGNVKLADDHLLIKPEVRVDFTQDDFFEDKQGAITKKSQPTVGVAFIYSFTAK
ncbi:porin [Pontibacter chitinilyticus]|uniref:porin n=1 Tax=Pontibacter chitinilyticus TaxID=2674989 RepID=UPI003219CA5C